ncbi:MAG TPA: PilZ domain-containing protein [Candidatus Acidoferrum sp.]|nr:PilZ domain-containing protein [Candidatus Acidoferrum sp.]
MALINFRYRERRRTVRVSLTVPITVHGKSGEGEKFVVSTHSQSVNRHGALFHLELPVIMGQQLLLVNDHTTHTAECRVINVRRARDGKNYVGVEFVNEDTNFWHMSFPIPGSRPLRRPSQAKQTA